MSAETLARIDATLVILDRAHKMSISSLDAPDDATTYGLAAVVLREARETIPEPPTDDEREALAKVLRLMLEPIDGEPVTNPEWIAAAIVSSAPWRNRHRGPITDAQRDLVADFLWNEMIGTAKSTVRKVMAEAFEDAGIHVEVAEAARKDQG